MALAGTGITRAQWEAISPLLAQAMELPERARGAWLAELDATQPTLSPLLRRLLSADLRAEQGHAFETVGTLAGGPNEPAHSSLEAGQQVGPYVLDRLLGRGGMGEVWLARQVEGGLTRNVALKLPTLLGATSYWRQRFQRERDILARLTHPHIAALYDAGISEAADSPGQPWLAMEYVQGSTLSDYARDHRLSVVERLQLFRQVLDAVSHAHRQLVVHRDLKPANILVDSAGRVKLLDFGIAKLLDDAEAATGDDLTRLAGRLLTYRYAAPEQLQGATITTGTDVYALGVILHELLSGLSPHAAVRDGRPLNAATLAASRLRLPSQLPIDAEAASERQAASPKALARTLAGDLDAILLRALRPDPVERYATVDQLDDELRRHLTQRAVLARRGTWRYLAGRFVARHRVPLAAASLLLVMLVGGLVTLERERRVAVAERARAERHFASVRKLANSFIVDIDKQLENLAGTLPAREQLVKTSLQYLDELAKEADNDPALRAELAAGYKRVGEVQGSGGYGQFGRYEEGIANLEKAAALYASLGDYGQDQRAIVSAEQRVHYFLGVRYLYKHDPRWRRESDEGVHLAERLTRMPGAGINDEIYLVTTRSERIRVDMYYASPTPAVLQEVAGLSDKLDRLLPQVAHDADARWHIALAYVALNTIVTTGDATAGQRKLGLVALRKAITIFEGLRKELPNDQRYAEYETVTRGQVTEALMLTGHGAESMAESDRVVQALLASLAKDGHNASTQETAIAMLSLATVVANLAASPGKVQERARQADEVHERMSPELRKQASVRYARMVIDYQRVRPHLALAGSPSAADCALLDRALANLPAYRHESPVDAAADTYIVGMEDAGKRCQARPGT